MPRNSRPGTGHPERRARSGWWRRFGPVLCLTGLWVGLLGCATPSNPGHAHGAKTLFEFTASTYHFPSVTATGKERDRLLRAAATGYERVLQQYPDQEGWCAKALRSLANVRVTQGRFPEAVQLYSRVAEQYPQQDWEILQAWKTAGDLLWEAGQPAEARKFYRQIVTRFDRPDPPAVIKLIVYAAKLRLA